MNLEDLKNQLKEKLEEAWSQIKDSPTYSSLREKYETLPPSTQKILVIGFIGIVVLFVVSIPYSYLASSGTFNQDYEETRQLTRQLLRASHMAQNAASLPQSMSQSDLQSRIQNDLNSWNLTAEQVGQPLPIETSSLGGSFVKSTKIQQAAVGLQLKKLNLKQVVDIAFNLQDINPSVKLAGVEIKASSPDPHYFDVHYKLVTFSLPQLADDPSPPGSGGGFRPPRNQPEDSGGQEAPPDEETEVE